jgi:hypothetical protein
MNLSEEGDCELEGSVVIFIALKANDKYGDKQRKL